MAFRVGGRPGTWGPGGVKALTPRNAGMSNVAQRTLDATVARANDQYLNAFFVDGIEIWHFSRTTASGVPCTCTYNQNRQPGPDDADDVQDVAEFGTKAPARGRLQSTTLLRTPPDRRAILPPKDFEITEGEEGLDWVDRVITPEGLGTDYDQALQDLQEINATGSLTVLDLGEPNHCGICFGSGWTQGYRLHGGTRVVLDASHATPFDVHGADVLHAERPKLFAASAGATECAVVWTLEIPAHFTRFFDPRVFCNTRRVYGWCVEFLPQGESEYVLMTEAEVLARAGTSYVAQIRARPFVAEEAEPSDRMRFSHIDFVFQHAAWPYAQLPPISEAVDLRSADRIVSVSAVFPPSFAEVRREDVFFERKYNALWKVIGVTDFKSAKGQILGWSVDARTVLKTDSLHALRLVLDATTVDPYQGLVQIQNAHTRPRRGTARRRKTGQL